MSFSNSSLHTWAIPKIQSILPVDGETASQIISQAVSEGSPEATGVYLKGFLGEESDALAFISDFTSRMPKPGPASRRPDTMTIASPTPSKPSSSTPKPAWTVDSSVPATKRKPQRGRGSNLGFKQPPRQANEGLGVGGSSSAGPGKAYMKQDPGDYIPKRSANNTPQPKADAISATTSPSLAPNTPLSTTPDAIQTPTRSYTATNSGNKKQQGTLTSDLLVPKSKPSRSKSPAPVSGSNNKIHIAANATMRPASSILSDLESAIRALEVSTNPSLLQSTNSTKRVKCDCMATTHDLLLAAPNCLTCGKIICIKEGLGPCTFCGRTLLSSSETQEMIQFLREERGREKMNLDNRANKRAEVSKTPRPFTTLAEGASLGYATGDTKPEGQSDEEYHAAALARAKAHRDKLLSYQAQNAKRTHIIDEAADFDTSAIESGGYGGLNMWASPAERALQLKKQQKRMAEIEWAAKEEYEKRQVVVSIDLTGKGGKSGAVVRREMREVAMDEVDNQGFGYGVGDVRSTNTHHHQPDDDAPNTTKANAGKYAHNPLLKSLIRPVFKAPTGSTLTKGKKPKPTLNTKDPTSTSYSDDEDYSSTTSDIDESVIPDIVKARVLNHSTGGGTRGGWNRVLQDDIEMENNEKWILDGGRQGVKVEKEWEEGDCG